MCPQLSFKTRFLGAADSPGVKALDLHVITTATSLVWIHGTTYDPWALLGVILDYRAKNSPWAPLWSLNPQKHKNKT